MEFSPAAKSLITHMAGGSPYLTRLLGNRSAGRALDNGRMRMTEEDVIHGTEGILAEWNNALPRRVQAQLQLPEVRSTWLGLIGAARASGTPDGWFMADDVMPELPDWDREAVCAMLDRFSTKLDLLERVEEGPGREPRFRFRTQGVPQLLHLSAALARSGR